MDSQEKSTFELFVASQEEIIKDVKELSMALGSMDAEDEKSMVSNRVHQTVGWIYLSSLADFQSPYERKSWIQERGQ